MKNGVGVEIVTLKIRSNKNKNKKEKFILVSTATIREWFSIFDEKFNIIFQNYKPEDPLFNCLKRAVKKRTRFKLIL